LPLVVFCLAPALITVVDILPLINELSFGVILFAILFLLTFLDHPLIQPIPTLIQKVQTSLVLHQLLNRRISFDYEILIIIPLQFHFMFVNFLYLADLEQLAEFKRIIFMILFYFVVV